MTTASLAPAAAHAIRSDRPGRLPGDVVEASALPPTSTMAIPPSPPEIAPTSTTPLSPAPVASPPSFLAGVPHAEEIDWVTPPGSSACLGSEGAAWWPAGDTITFGGGRLIAEHASNQVCVSLGAAHVHDVALHESAHWWQAHVIGVVRIYDDFGGGYPINSQADYVRFTRDVLEPLADCAARSWGASWIHYGCPASLAHAYGL
ncbi:MAG: hypothetical protein ACXWA3_05805 [Acidimicrobiales bacterium]